MSLAIVFPRRLEQAARTLVFTHLTEPGRLRDDRGMRREQQLRSGFREDVGEIDLVVQAGAIALVDDVAEREAEIGAPREAVNWYITPEDSKTRSACS